jgi:hypothetical protein
MTMSTDPGQPLVDELARVNGEIDKFEAQMRETAPLSEYRRLIEQLNDLRTRRDEIGAKLKGSG